MELKRGEQYSWDGRLFPKPLVTRSMHGLIQEKLWEFQY